MDISSGTLVFTHNKLQVDYTNGTAVFKDDSKVTVWSTLQFHFHSPSEHKINGKLYDAEMHMVFQGVTVPTELLVLGLIFEVNDTYGNNEFIDSLNLNSLNLAGSNNTNLIISLNNLYANLCAQDKYNYLGSLTTPPCSETVNWFVFKNTMKITSAQLEEFSRLWKENEEFASGNGNNRVIQNLNGRSIYLISKDSETLVQSRLNRNGN